MEFDQEKHEEFLSSGSKSPRVARQYRRVSSQVSSETSQKMACANRAISGRVTCVARVTSPMRPARPTSLKANLAMSLLFLSSKLPGVPNNQ